MKRTQLMELFAVAAILSSCTSAVCADPTESLQRDRRDCRALDELACLAPVPTLGQVTKDVLVQGLNIYNKLAPVIKPPTCLTPQESIDLLAISIQRQKFFNVSMPAVIELLSSNTPLTPEQIQHVNDAISLRLIIAKASQCSIDGLAPKLNYTCAQKQTVDDLADANVYLYGLILSIVSDPKGQLVISPAQVEEIKKITEKKDQILCQALEAFNEPPPATITTTTTTTTTKAPAWCGC